MGKRGEQELWRSFLFFLACRERFRLRFRRVTLVSEATTPSFLKVRGLAGDGLNGKVKQCRLPGGGKALGFANARRRIGTLKGGPFKTGDGPTDRQKRRDSRHRT